MEWAGAMAALGQGPPQSPCSYIHLLSLCQAAALAGLRLHGGGSVQESINSIAKVRAARCRLRPSGKNEDHGACSVLRAAMEPAQSRRQAGTGCAAGPAAVLSASAGPFFASLVLQEQLLRDPTRPCTWLLPSPCLLAPGASQRRTRREGAGKGSPEHLTGSPHLSTWQRQALPQTGLG